MSDAPEESPGEQGSDRVDAERSAPADDLDELRREVDEKYDFDDFGPADMEEMTVEEWEAAFDPDTWITGEALLDRVEDDLASRVASREVFARLERESQPPRLLAYSDEGYAIVYPDGSVAGEGTVLRDVKPSVALCSMESYDVPEPPTDASLPKPEDVPEQSGELGNLMLQVVAGIQVVAAVILFGAGVVSFGGSNSNAWLFFVAGFGFLAVGLLLFFTVANARLSDAFRAEEYRNRLRAVGSAGDGRPEYFRKVARDVDDESPAAPDQNEGTSAGKGSSSNDEADGVETGDTRENGGATSR